MQLSFVAGEIRNPQRNVLFALAFGSIACIAIYLLANMAYLRVLPIPEIAASERVGATSAQLQFALRFGLSLPPSLMPRRIRHLNGHSSLLQEHLYCY